METKASRIITALSTLDSMDRLQTGIDEPRHAVIDLQTALIFEEHADYPNGEYLAAELPSGKRIKVTTDKLIGQVVLKHAKAQSARDGKQVQQAYEHAHNQFMSKIVAI